MYALYDLCAYPDHVEPLRLELESVSREELTGKLDHMQFLDSFIKESARLSASDSSKCALCYIARVTWWLPEVTKRTVLTQLVSIRRKAIAPFTFSNGLHVPQGNWVCVPQRALMRDPKHYAHPMAFEGFRFARNRHEGFSDTDKDRPSRFTDVNHSFPIWGAGKLAWFVISLLILEEA